MTKSTLKSQAEIDRDDAISILTACAQDIDQIEAAIAPSKRTGGFRRALESLRARVAVGQQMKAALHAKR